MLGDQRATQTTTLDDVFLSVVALNQRRGGHPCEVCKVGPDLNCSYWCKGQRLGFQHLSYCLAAKASLRHLMAV